MTTNETLNTMIDAQELKLDRACEAPVVLNSAGRALSLLSKTEIAAIRQSPDARNTYEVLVSWSATPGELISADLREIRGLVQCLRCYLDGYRNGLSTGRETAVNQLVGEVD